VAVELATAYFSFLPSMAGTAAAAAPGLRALEVQTAASGVRGGAAMGAGIGAGLGRTIPLIAGVLATIGIADFFSNAIDSASDLNESANAVRVSFGDAAKEVEALSSTAADRLGVSSNDFNSLAVRFASFSRTIAGEGGDVAATLDEITTRGADFASVYNVDVADALTLFQSGLAGETEPLRRFGIDLSAARVQADAYRFGIAEVGAELTEQEKIQARYMSLMEQTEIVAGDRINTEDQLANKQRENAAKFEDALARIGTALLPAATSFANFIGSDENLARLDKMIALFEKGEPAITAIADAFLLLADLKLSELDTIFAFLDAMEDGNISLQESVEILDALPDHLQTLAFGLANFSNGIVNTVIDGTNAVRKGFADIINFAATVLGIGTKVRYTPVPHVSTVVGFSATGGGLARKRFPGQADGGVTTAAGWSWVGERGPELMHMSKGATVVPLDAAAGVGTDLRPYIVRLIEAVEAKRILVADGQVLAETASSGFAQQASLGAA
jgi:hypothetical protein